MVHLVGESTRPSAYVSLHRHAAWPSGKFASITGCRCKQRDVWQDDAGNEHTSLDRTWMEATIPLVMPEADPWESVGTRVKGFHLL